VPGGAETYVVELARALEGRHQVTVLTGSRSRIEGIETIHLPRLRLLDPGESESRKILWHALDQWLPQVHIATTRALRRVQPDVVSTHHSHGLSAAVFTAVAASRLPHVHTAHDLTLLCARLSMTKNGVFCGGRCASCRVQRLVRGTAVRLNIEKLIGVSTYVCDRHVEAGIVSRERAAPISLGAQPATPRLRQRRDDSLTLGFIGALSPHKGVRTLLTAMARSGERSWRLVLAGSGPLEAEVRDAASADNRISFLGQVGGVDKDGFFEQLDLVVIPSEWEEPATFVAVESALRGIPTVVSDRGGLVEQPETRTFSAGDADGLLAGIRWYLEGDRLRTTSERLIEKHERYLWSTHVSQVEQILAGVKKTVRG
jgi:glycosyltransferase involved in cell wall biosynthesis